MPSKTSPINLDTFNKLISSIYDAAIDATLWPMFIQHLTHTLNAHSGLLRVQDLQLNEVGLYITHGVIPEYQQKYIEYYVHNDPLISAAAKHKIGTPLQSAAFLPESFRKTEFFNDYNSPQGMEQIIGGLLVKNKSRIALLGVHRRDQIGVYKPHEVTLLELLFPHLQRAFHVNSYLFQLKNDINATHDVLHRLPVGIILVDAMGKPIFVNNHVETILDESPDLTLSRSGLQARTRKHTQALHKLIHEASRSPQKTGSTLTIPTLGSAHPLSILVIPINQDNNFNFDIDTSQATAALFINTAGQQHTFSQDILCNHYGLTQAEARLAAALANGQSLEMIAEKFRLSKHTVRSQLKSCFHKTGTHRQTELVKLILSDPAALIHTATQQKSI